MSESDVGGKRWTSRALVSMLVKEMQNYNAAAEIVSGSEDVFSMCGRNIEEKIAEVEKKRSVATAFELQKTLEEARLEVAGHEAWQKEVIEGLPKQDDVDGLTGPLRLAFAKSAKAREQLLEQINEAFTKYFTEA